MNEDLTTFVTKELVKPQAREKIIKKVCKKGGLNWREAERLVVLIEARHNRTAVTRRAPFLFFLSIGALVLGIGLLASDAKILLALLQTQAVNLVEGHYAELFGGFGMTAGGMIGLWKALGYIFPN